MGIWGGRIDAEKIKSEPFESNILVYVNLLFIGLWLGNIYVFVSFCNLLTIFLQRFK